MSKGIKLKTWNDLNKASSNDKYILILKRPQSKSRIHKGKCKKLISLHLLGYEIEDHVLGTGNARQQYFSFDNLEDAKNEYPARLSITNARCKFCGKKTDF